MKQGTYQSDSADEAERDDMREDPMIPDEEEPRQLDKDETNVKDGKYIDFALYCYTRLIRFQGEKDQNKYFKHAIGGFEGGFPLGSKII